MSAFQADGSFKNILHKHFQIGFIFILDDVDNRCNVFHCHISSVMRRPSSMEEAKLFSVDVALERFRNQRKIMFQFL